MSGKLRKSQAHTARRQRHADKRAQKRESARSHSKQVPRSQRRSNTAQFPTWLAPVFQSSHKSRKSYVLTGERAS